MKCLSVKQPFADWILQGIKPRELRIYPLKYQGPLLIHSSKIPDVEFMKQYGIDSLRFRNGCILGMVISKGSIQYAPGSYAWIMESLRIFNPFIPHKGKLGLYDIEMEDLEIDHASEDFEFLERYFARKNVEDGKEVREIPSA